MVKAKKPSTSGQPEKSFLVRQRNEVLKTLSDIAQLLQGLKQEDKPLASIVRIVRRAMQADVCSLYILQDHTLVLVATEGLDPAAIGKVSMPLGKGLTGLVAETGKPVIEKNASLNPRFEYFPETGEERFESFLGVPLLEREKLVGVMTIQMKDSQSFSEDTVDLLQVIAFQLSNVIQNLVTLEAFLQKPSKRRSKPFKVTGVGVSPGIVVGPAFILKTEFGTAVSYSKDIDPERELPRIKLALREASHDLVQIEKELLKKFTQKESDIFNAHRMILKDNHFREKLNKEIAKKRSAEVAVVNVVGNYVKTFARMDDPYLRDRAADIEDLGQRLLRKLGGKQDKFSFIDGEGVLIANRLTPSETALLDPARIRAIVTVRGGNTSHAAILARSLGIPAIMGIPENILDVASKQLVIVDGNNGDLYVDPPKEVLEEYEKVQQKYADRLVQLNTLADQPAKTKDGRLIHLEANVGLVDTLHYLKHYGAEGVGLYRTEFPFMIRESLPNEGQQYRVYKRILEAANGLPVTFRTLDAGSDKPISYLHLGEDESFLGYRSIRLCLKEPHILKTQLKALLRAAQHGPTRLLFPMISGLEELRAVKKLVRDVKRDLRNRKERIRIPDMPIGIMIEVPSAVQLAHLLIKEVDFFSIGTNDLIQFTLAVDRNNEKVADFFEPFHPAVIHSLSQVVEVVRRAGKWVSICGEVAGDPMMTALLVGLGFEHLSMIPANIPLIKGIIRDLEYKKLHKDVEKVLGMATARDIRRRMERYQPKTLG